MDDDIAKLRQVIRNLTRNPFPRLIVAQSLEQVYRLAKIQGGPVPQDYIPYAQEKRLSLRNSGLGMKEALLAMSNDRAFYLLGEEVVLYHIRTDEERAKDAEITVEGQYVGDLMCTPWAGVTDHIAPQIWYIDKNDVATNLRARFTAPDQWGGKIDLNAVQEKKDVSDEVY